MSPSIFNAVVDAVVRHWDLFVEERSGGQDRSGREGLHHGHFFYADDGLVSSIDLEWLQGELDTLTGLFDRLGLQKNVGNTVGMVCHPCQAAGTNLEAAHKWRIMGEGLIYRERQRVRAKCSDCGEEMAVGSLSVFQPMQHGREAGDIQ